MKKIAIIPGKGLGDGLIYMTLAHHFLKSGFKVTLFSSPLTELEGWFPHVAISSIPQPCEMVATFSNFDMVIASDHSMVDESASFGNGLYIIKESSLDKKKSYVENLIHLLLTKFKLQGCQKDNGIKPPQDLIYRKYPKRVIIHPTSSEEKKNWPAQKYHQLAVHLEELDYTPVFCVSPHERESWPESPLFPMISDAASFIYESGYHIGNDSGIGHLASSLHIPTLTLFARSSYSHLWRPGFGLGMVISPPNFLIGSRLKQKYWKKSLSVKRVLSSFCLLVDKGNHSEDPVKKQGEKR